MKIIFKIFLFLIFTSFLLAEPQNSSTEALYEVISELFIKPKLLFDILVFGDMTPHFGDKINNLVKKLENQSVILTKSNTPNGVWVLNSAVIFVERKLFTPENLKTLWVAKSKTKFLFLVEDEKLDLKSIAVTPNAFYGQISHFAYFLVDHEKHVELKTFEWWTEDACNELQLVTLNSFDKKLGKWNENLEIQEKFFNFHECPLKTFSIIYTISLVDFLRDEGMIYLPPIAPEIFEIRDYYEEQIVDIFAKQGNFTSERPPYDDPLFQISMFQPNNVNTDYTFYLRSFIYRFNHLDCSTPFFNQIIRTMCSPPELYSNFEKMVLPFDFDTWMYLIITFVAASTMIFLINLLPKVAKNIIYGSRVTMPLFNMFGAFFGIGQTRLPEHNFGRIILIFFIIFCLIFRTAYQGVFFEMMTSDMRKSPPESYADLKERNFTLYVITNRFNLAGFLSQMIDDDERPTMTDINFYEILNFYKNMSNKSLSPKTAYISSEIDYKVLRSYAKHVPKLMKQKLELEPWGICAFKNNFISKLIEDTMGYLVQAGIPQHFFNFFMDFELMPMIPDPTERRIFSFSDLQFGFVIWLIACGISTSVFFGELLWKYLKDKIKKAVSGFVGLILFLHVFQNFNLFQLG